MRHVYHVHQEIGLGDLFQGRPKGGHQHGGQFLNETDGVGYQNLASTR